MDIKQYFKQPQNVRMTQNELANKIGRTQGAIGHWLNGDRIPDEYAIKLHKVTGSQIHIKDSRPDLYKFFHTLITSE